MNNALLKKKYGQVRKIEFSTGYLNGVKALAKDHRNKELSKLKTIVGELSTFDVDTQYHNHVLNNGNCELHVSGDVLLVYKYETDSLYVDLHLEDLTNHKKLIK